MLLIPIGFIIFSPDHSIISKLPRLYEVRNLADREENQAQPIRYSFVKETVARYGRLQLIEIISYVYEIG